VVLFTPLGRSIKNMLQGDGSSSGSALHRAGTALPVSDTRPSLVVLPLDNISDERHLEFLADGLTEDLTTMLGRVPHYFVIARNTAFSYKGKTPNLKDIGRELGVRYALEGSVRKIGDNIRVTVQLIDTNNGTHIWAEKTDTPAETIEASQDDIAQSIAMDVCAELTRVEAADASKRGTKDQDAWTYYQQAKATLLFKGWSEISFAETADLLRKAIKKDADFAPAHGYLALILAIGHLVHFVKDPEATRKEALKAMDTALSLAPDSSEVLGYVGCAYSDLGMETKGVPIIEKAIELDQTNAQAFAALGAAKVINGDVDNGVTDLERAIELTPQYAGSAPWKVLLSVGYAKQSNFDAAIDMARKANKDDPKYYPGYIAMACAHIIQEDIDAAREAMAEARRVSPGLNAEKVQVFMGRQAVALLESAGVLHEATEPN